MERARKLGIIVALVSGVVFAFSLVSLMRAIEAHNERADFPFYSFEVLDGRELTWSGRDITLTDFTDDEGRAFIKLEYGDLVIDIPVREPTAKNLPTLGLYNEWAKVLAMAEVERNDEGELDAIEGTGRMLIVTRRTPEGYDSETWGRVRRKDWTFDYYTLETDGTVTTETWRWPPSRHESDEQRASNPIPPLGERTWQYQAAMHVIPALSVPKQKFKNTALWYENVGPVLPIAGISALAFLFGLGFAFSPRKATSATYEEPEQQAPTR